MVINDSQLQQEVQYVYEEISNTYYYNCYNRFTAVDKYGQTKVTSHYFLVT